MEFLRLVVGRANELRPIASTKGPMVRCGQDDRVGWTG